jgi:glucose 1-dehydrogenase
MRAGGADYTASKGGQRNLTQTLPLEVAGDGITVNAIASGMILTLMNQTAKDHWIVRNVKSEFIPLKRPGKPEEVANVVVFLASPAGAYFTGATVTIDGGLFPYAGPWRLKVGEGVLRSGQPCRRRASESDFFNKIWW